MRKRRGTGLHRNETWNLFRRGQGSENLYINEHKSGQQSDKEEVKNRKQE